MNIREITFEEILPFWKELWEGRKSPIEPVSSMLYLGGYDVEIKTEYTPMFLGIFDEDWFPPQDKLVAVNSGVRTSPTHYRSRGLYVKKEFRGQHLASWLLDETIQQAMNEGCEIIWSLPRKAALPAYESMGFKKTSDWFDEGMEFGPNCYVMRELNV